MIRKTLLVVSSVLLMATVGACVTGHVREVEAAFSLGRFAVAIRLSGGAIAAGYVESSALPATIPPLGTEFITSSGVRVTPGRPVDDEVCTYVALAIEMEDAFAEWSGRKGKPVEWTRTSLVQPARIVPIRTARLSLWLPGVLFAAYPVVAVIVPNLRSFRRAHREQDGLCVECGYDLTGNVSGVCPECGRMLGTA